MDKVKMKSVPKKLTAQQKAELSEAAVECMKRCRLLIQMLEQLEKAIKINVEKIPDGMTYLSVLGMNLLLDDIGNRFVDGADALGMVGR